MRAPRVFGVHQVVDFNIPPQLEGAGNRVVDHARGVSGFKVGGSEETVHLRGADKAFPVMGALGQELQHIFRAHDGEDPGFEVAIDRGNHELSAGT